MGKGPGSVSAPAHYRTAAPAPAAPLPRPATAHRLQHQHQQHQQHPPPLQPPPMSRYRSLRGKSISSPAPYFDVFRSDDDAVSTAKGNGSGAAAVISARTGGDSCSSASTSTSASTCISSGTASTSASSEELNPVHRRTKTAPSRHASTASRPPMPPPPPLPDFSSTPVLCPRPVNATLKPSLTALESLKSAPNARFRETSPSRRAAHPPVSAAVLALTRQTTDHHHHLDEYDDILVDDDDDDDDEQVQDDADADSASHFTLDHADADAAADDDDDYHNRPASEQLQYHRRQHHHHQQQQQLTPQHRQITPRRRLYDGEDGVSLLDPSEADANFDATADATAVEIIPPSPPPTAIIREPLPPPPPPPPPKQEEEFQQQQQQTPQNQHHHLNYDQSQGQLSPSSRSESPLPPLPPLPLHNDKTQRTLPADQSPNKTEAVLLAQRLEAETDRILAEQKKLDLARLQAQLVTTPPPKSSTRRPLLGSLTFLARGRRSSAKRPGLPGISQPSTPSTLSPSIFSPALPGTSVFSRSSSVDDSPRMSFIEPGGKGIVPQIDAPTSAINAGERRVIVRCLSSTISMPFNVDTSPLDLVVASAEKTNHVITPATCIVVECYFMLGLERRLRGYERVRDICNSWDNDEQNSLLILPCDSIKKDRGYDLSTVPRTKDPPPGFCLQLHHSARPGKWNKRWITLVESGQIFASKRAEASPYEKDSIVLCHLSDFDIYSPKESEMRRNLKPPKKFCYAIKSQQKTTAFPNGENFVHFFCTDDDRLAARFNELVHGWRSWYLVNRLIDLARKEKPPQISHSPLLGGKSPRGADRGPRVSINGAAYTNDEPLMDVSGFKVPDVSLIRLETAAAKPAPKEPAPRSKGPMSPPRATAAAAAATAADDDEASEFSAGGLLGDAYEKRKQEEAASAKARFNAQPDGPFTEGPSLLNGGVSGGVEAAAAAAANRPEPKSWFPSAAEHSARQRSQSGHVVSRRPMTADAGSQLRRDKMQQQHQPQQPQPLLSFGKDFPEPPRIREFHPPAPRNTSGQPLINFATGGPPQLPGAPPQRSMSRRGVSTSSSPATGSMPQQPLVGSRGRSRSTVGPGPSGSGRRFNVDEPPPPMPSLPHRTGRRDGFGGRQHNGNGPASSRHPEPLVSRAR